MKMKMISFNGKPIEDMSIFQRLLMQESMIAASMLGPANSNLAASEIQGRLTIEKLEAQRREIEIIITADNTAAMIAMSRAREALKLYHAAIEEGFARRMFPWLAGGLLLVLCALVAAQVVR